MKIMTITFLVFIFIILQFQLWLSKDGFFSVMQMKHKIELQQSNNVKLKKRNAQLKFEVKELKHGDQGIEARARNDLGMIKKDEVFYQVVKSHAPEK